MKWTMRLAGLICLAAAAASLSAQPARPAPAESRTAYRHATLIDGRGGPALPGRTVIIRGERIEAVVPDAEATPAMMAEARTVDLTGRHLLPGLIDSHQHIATPPNRRRAEALMRRDLFSGITATRIMADDLRSVAEIARSAWAFEISSPDLYFAALMAGPSFFDDPRTADAAQGVTPGQAPWMQSIDDATNLPLAIARARGTGAIAIKIYANLPGPLIRRITEEAHRQGMQVWAHGMVFPTPPADVIAAGPDSISHTCYLAYQAVSPRPATYQRRSRIDPAQFADGNNPVMTGLFADMRRRGIVLDATLRVYRELERNSTTSGRPPYCTLDLGALLTAQAHRAGVEIAAGTDGDTASEQPYPALFEELELLVSRAGLTPAQAIRSATLGGAMAMGQQHEFGTVEPGRLANLVILERDPLADIANMRSVTMTVKRGREYQRAYYLPIRATEMGGDD